MPLSDVTHFLSTVPLAPGVYCMRAADGKILYVGKAHQLKKRLSSYFLKQQHSPKTEALLRQVERIDITVTRSETEALLLESTLIKRERPKYNVILRDDKSYPYIHITLKQDFPRIEMVRLKKKPDSAEYFGPYPNTHSVREALLGIQKIFHIRNCRDSFFNARTRPCLQYQIKRCTAPCTGYINKADYQECVTQALRFLQGKSQEIPSYFAEKMEQAVARLDFEEAAKLRDQLKSLRLIQESQYIVQQRGDLDVIALNVHLGIAVIQHVCIRKGDVLSTQAFYPDIRCVSFDDEIALKDQILEAFIGFYYMDELSRIPKTLIISENLPSLPTIECALNRLLGKQVHIIINPRGKNAKWLAFACNNLQLNLQTREKALEQWHVRYQSIAHILQVASFSGRIECFDISHTSGQQAVASCVVFDMEGPVKKAYRRFNITGITGGDDYAAMEQALTRRLKRLLQDNALPGLLIVDGGEGQVQVARRVLQLLNIHTVFLMGIVKGEGRKPELDRLIIPHLGQIVSLPSESKALHLLQFIRDEAHRFAIQGHRKKREKSGIASSLESIEGVGAKKRYALLQYFGGLRELAKAPLEEIMKVPGIHEALALRIFHHFHA